VSPSDDIQTFWSRWQAEIDRWPSPADRAAAGGFFADRLGFAFATGYQAALSALCPHWAGLCAT
jgi:hypothetical protein